MQYLSYVIKKAVDRVVVKEDDFYLQEKSFIDLLINHKVIFDYLFKSSYMPV